MKKIVKIAFVAAFASIAGYGVYTSQKTELMSDLALANVEALAQSESGTGSCTETCYREEGWRCTRIYNGNTSVCYPYRKK